MGNFSQAILVADPEWLLFLPSLYGFVLFDCYANTVEYNKLFEFEQARFLRDNYQDESFEMPI
ncbi:MAG: hypothetical protein H7Y41_02240 [Hyphomonadaceae bacterium]|nr:hypothetical protein [Clostridia bacterium]